MKKGIKILLITLGSIVAIIALAIASFAIYLNVSPNFGIWLLRQNFGGETEVINVSNYESIKENVSVTKDLIYPSKDSKNKYDIYLPKGVNKPLPTIFWVHGGAFVAGTKDGVENYATMLANEGYAVIAADYEWAPEIRYPGQARQMEECLKELNNVKDKYYLDLDNLILVGDSAGAHIVSQVALLATNPFYENALSLRSSITKEQVKGTILYCGPYDVEEMLDFDNDLIEFLASSIGWALFNDKDWDDNPLIETTTIKDYVTKDFPKTFITDGNSGSFEKQGKELFYKLNSVGVETEALFFDKSEYPNLPHEYQFNIGDNKAGSICYQKTLEFLDSLNLN